MKKALLFFIFLARPPAAEAQQRVRIALLDTAVLAAPRLLESSGVAASLRHPGLLWTHNDSGDEPILYATDSTGRDGGYLRVAAARAVDWEDMAAGPCMVAPGACLYVGDIGDNASRRTHVVVYRLAEPDPPAGAADTNRIAPLLDSIVLRYPDHPHDAEALGVTPAGDLLIVTKERIGPPLLFRAPAPHLAATVSLEQLGTLDIAANAFIGRVVTGAAVSPNGTMLAVRTYVSLHLFRLSPAGVERISEPEGVPVPVVESQGEAVTFDGNSRLVLTSERGSPGRALLTRLAILIH